VNEDLHAWRACTAVHWALDQTLRAQTHLYYTPSPSASRSRILRCPKCQTGSGIQEAIAEAGIIIAALGEARFSQVSLQKK
jgi:hypothetical protein